MVELNALLKHYRTKHALTSTEMAAKLGISSSQYSKIETGVSTLGGKSMYLALSFLLPNLQASLLSIEASYTNTDLSVGYTEGRA